MNLNATAATRIRVLDDRFRIRLIGGTALLTSGVIALGDEAQAKILAAGQAFDAFSPDNDPWRQHDFGAVEITAAKDGAAATTRIFFKIEYFHLTRARGSDGSSDETRTERVMAITLANEY